MARYLCGVCGESPSASLMSETPEAGSLGAIFEIPVVHIRANEEWWAGRMGFYDCIK